MVTWQSWENGMNDKKRFGLNRVVAPLDGMEPLEASATDCRAIALWLNNDAADKRSKARKKDETLEALVAFAPRFEEAGPKSGFSCHRVGHDASHRHIASGWTCRKERVPARLYGSTGFITDAIERSAGC